MSNFDPSKLNSRTPKTSQRGPRPERIFMVVDEYSTPESGFHYAIGHRAGHPDQKIKVRLNTVAERVADRPNLKEDAVKAQYVTGENTRDSISDKAKAGIKLIAFDDCRRLGEVDGVTEYRAHWPKTIATQPDAEILTGKAHIRLREAYERADTRFKAQAYVELIKGSATATADNITDLMSEALTIKDAQGRARDPLMIMRVTHKGAVVRAPRMYPATRTTQVFDQALGENKDVSRPCDADQTISELMSGVKGRTDLETAQRDSFRAAVAAIKGEPEPAFSSTDAEVIKDVRNLYWGVKEGHLQVEVISAEKIDFGADSRKTYLKDKDLPQLAAYTIKEPTGDQSFRSVAGYTDTVIGILRHEDGEPYAVYASPVQMFPKAYKLADLRLESGAPAAEAEATTDADNTAESDAAEIPPMATQADVAHEDEAQVPSM
ncbi:hypothetical protein [Bordetella flabilis]|uniref:Uncharacterized protein n=1 Tax=Bordetella flabilis TaxID=463014 RepID=A0A193GMQ5_9BORD|nr:hypothetical protein [Bordetella flabilis]ANN80893.1 hypothetical protein BAU07_26610 [Bordetella flabilis]